MKPIRVHLVDVKGLADLPLFGRRTLCGLATSTAGLVTVENRDAFLDAKLAEVRCGSCLRVLFGSKGGGANERSESARPGPDLDGPAAVRPGEQRTEDGPPGGCREGP